jgi:hypothetical protein
VGCTWKLRNWRTQKSEWISRGNERQDCKTFNQDFTSLGNAADSDAGQATEEAGRLEANIIAKAKAAAVSRPQQPGRPDQGPESRRKQQQSAGHSSQEDLTKGRNQGGSSDKQSAGQYTAFGLIYASRLAAGIGKVSASSNYD